MIVSSSEVRKNQKMKIRSKLTYTWWEGWRYRMFGLQESHNTLMPICSCPVQCRQSAVIHCAGICFVFHQQLHYCSG